MIGLMNVFDRDCLYLCNLFHCPSFNSDIQVRLRVHFYITIMEIPPVLFLHMGLQYCDVTSKYSSQKVHRFNALFIVTSPVFSKIWSQLISVLQVHEQQKFFCHPIERISSTLFLFCEIVLYGSCFSFNILCSFKYLQVLVTLFRTQTSYHKN